MPRESKASRELRQREERAQQMQRDIDQYPTRLMQALENACKLGYPLKIENGAFVVNIADRLYREHTMGYHYSEDSNRNLESLNNDILEHHLWIEEEQRQARIRESALKKLTDEELVVLGLKG